MKYVIALDDIRATKRELAGGKGASLASLKQAGFQVPDGVVVSALGHAEFVGDALENTEISGASDLDAFEELSARVNDDLSRRDLPAGVRAELAEAWQALGTELFYAVRSSSTLEDGGAAAFAGQHDTFLNCWGIDEILENLKACYSSLWSARAIAYRYQHGLGSRPVAMAVVVQRMVPCTTAGVAFSVNPISGDVSEILVNANFGLGESVVSGSDLIDQFHLDKQTGGVRQARVSPKRLALAPRGVLASASAAGPPAEETETPALSSADLGRLGTLVREIEDFYQFPQDIEWGLANDEFFVLQSRPITAIPPRWTRDESAERFPQAITPLTWDFVEEGFHQSLEYSFRLMRFPAFSGKWFASFGHYIYGNQTAVEWYGRRRPFAVRSAAQLRSQLPALRHEFRWVQELPIRWQRDLDHYLIELGRFEKEDLAAKDTGEVWDYVSRVQQHGVNYFLPNIAISITQSALYRTLQHFLSWYWPDPGAAATLTDDLLAFCETKTAQVNQELEELAQCVAADASLRSLLEAESSRAFLGLPAGIESLPGPMDSPAGHLTGYPEFAGRFLKFLRDHGHREVEFDAYFATWAEAPWIVLDHVRLLLARLPENPPGARERDSRIRMMDAEAKVFERVPADLQFFFRELIRLSRRYTALDDLEHYQTTRLTLPLRRGLRELGRRLAAQGVIANPMDVFFAHRSQLADAIAANSVTGWDQLRESVRIQKAAYWLDRVRRPAWVLEAVSSDETVGIEPTLSGLAGSPGEAKGRIVVISSVEDFARFPRGGVLLARTTHPTWTPLFYSAAAVITESGGPLSHGAVTARELGIPAVMSVRHAFEQLAEGEYVRVDGTHGKIYRCD